MATLDKVILTNAGQDLINKVNAGKSKIEYTKAIFSSSNYNNKSDSDIKKMTKLDSEDLISSGEDLVILLSESGDTQIRAYADNSHLDHDIYINSYAIFAKGSDNNEIMYAIELSSHSDYLIANIENKTPQGVFYTITTRIENTNNFTFSSDKTIYVTKEDLKNYAKQSDLDVVEENVNKNINDDNSPINQKISSLQSDKASNDDLNQQYTQTKKLFSMKYVQNAKESAAKDPEPHIYKDNKNALYQGGGVGNLLFETIPFYTENSLNNANLNDFTTTGIYSMYGALSISNFIPDSKAGIFGYLKVIAIRSDVWQYYYDTNGSVFQRIRMPNQVDWSYWQTLNQGHFLF